MKTGATVDGHRMKQFFLPAQLLLVALIAQAGLVSGDDNPLAFLRKKFYDKIDVNPVFTQVYNQVNREQAICDSYNAIYCPALSQQTLTMSQSYSQDIALRKNNLQKALYQASYINVNSQYYLTYAYPKLELYQALTDVMFFRETEMYVPRLAVINFDEITMKELVKLYPNKDQTISELVGWKHKKQALQQYRIRANITIQIDLQSGATKYKLSTMDKRKKLSPFEILKHRIYQVLKFLNQYINPKYIYAYLDAELILNSFTSNSTHETLLQEQRVQTERAVALSLQPYHQYISQIQSGRIFLSKPAKCVRYWQKNDIQQKWQMSSSPGEGDLAREYLFPSTLNLDNIALEFNRTVVAMTPAERSQKFNEFFKDPVYQEFFLVSHKGQDINLNVMLRNQKYFDYIIQFSKLTPEEQNGLIDMIINDMRDIIPEEVST